MKRNALGPMLGLATFGLVATALAQAPAGSTRPGKPFNAHPGGSGGPPHQPFRVTAPLGSTPPAPSGQRAELAGRRSPGLQKRLLELSASHKARHDAHVSALRGRFSELHLKNEALRNELRRHARSVAFLTHARLIAEEELTEPKRAKVLKRIEVLLAKEQARHDRHVSAFTHAGPGPSGSAPPFASGFVPPLTPSGTPPHAGSGAPKQKLPPRPAASAGGAL